MKPEASLPGFAPEKAPIQRSPEIGRDIDNLAVSPEIDKEIGAERYEQKSELGAIYGDVGLTTVIPTPVSRDVNAVNDTSFSVNPLVANDDDLIEKEWVDRAKKIVAETHDNPNLREKEVSKMQVDYIKKRFGRNLGDAE